MAKLDIRRILCPIDFSALSTSALEQAIAVAAWYEAALTALHVMADTTSPITEPVHTANSMLIHKALRQTIQAELSSLVRPARRVGLNADGELREGNPATEIARVAQELHSDLIVMGTHGRSGCQGWGLGSVAETVLRRAPCPVLTVPAHVGARARPMLFKRILCGTDFSPASEAAVGYAATLTEEADASLLLVHVLDRPSAGERPKPRFDGNGNRADFECATRAQLARALPRHARDCCRPEEILMYGSVAPEILRLASEREADLIVMGVHGRNLLDLMAFGSVTHQVVREATCSVLTVRPPRRYEEGRASHLASARKSVPSFPDLTRERPLDH